MAIYAVVVIAVDVEAAAVPAATSVVVVLVVKALLLLLGCHCWRLNSFLMVHGKISVMTGSHL